MIIGLKWTSNWNWNKNN